MLAACANTVKLEILRELLLATLASGSDSLILRSVHICSILNFLYTVISPCSPKHPYLV